MAFVTTRLRFLERKRKLTLGIYWLDTVSGTNLRYYELRILNFEGWQMFNKFLFFSYTKNKLFYTCFV